MDKEQKKTVNGGEEDIVLESSTNEPNPLEVSEDTVKPEKTDKSTEESKTDGGKKFSGAEKRIHEVVSAKKQAEMERDEAKREAESLSQKLRELTGVIDTPTGISTSQPSQDNGERELTIDDLRSIARLEVEKERTVNRINAQASEAIKLNPELDKDSAIFDPDINEAVTSAVLLEVQKDPSKDVLKLTEKYMKPYRKAAERAVGDEKATLAKQVSETALRPNNIKPVDKGFQDKSIEEMEQVLEMVN